MTFDLAAAIKAVQPQFIINVPTGYYPAVTLRNLRPATPVRIIGDGAVEFAGLQVTGCSNLNFEGIDVHNPAPASASSPIVFIQSSSDIGFSGGKVSGARVGGLLLGKGISISNSARVTISGNEVFDLFKGISLADAPGAMVQGNDVHDIRTSAIDGGGDLSKVQVLDNYIHDLVPVAAQVDHSDGGHFWTKNNKKPIDGMVVRGNRLVQAVAGGSLCMNFEGTPAPGGFTNLTVENNTAHWNNHQGVTTNWVLSGSFKNNSLLPAPGLDNPAHAPGFVFRNSGVDVEVSGNTCAPGPSMKPFAGQNTFLTAVQIAAYGAAR